VQRRMEQIEGSINRYMSALDTADQEEAITTQRKTSKLKDKIAALKKRMDQLKEIGVLVQATPDKQISLTDPDARLWPQAAREPVSWATMSRPPWMPNIT
jgi:transposase